MPLYTKPSPKSPVRATYRSEDVFVSELIFVTTSALTDITSKETYKNPARAALKSCHKRSDGHLVVGVMKMGNTAPRVGIGPTFLAFQTRVLTITPPRLPVTILPTSTWLCGSLPEMSVQTTILTKSALSQNHILQLMPISEPKQVYTQMEFLFSDTELSNGCWDRYKV